MKRLLSSSTIAATLLLSTTHIMAADYDQGVVTKAPAETYTEVEFGSGWYLRGDITFNSRGKSKNTIAPVGHPDDEFSVQLDYDDVIGFKGGFGYQYNPYLRFDVTAASTMKGDFSGSRQQGFGGSRVVSYTDSSGNEQENTIHFDSEGNVIGSSSGSYAGSSVAPIGGTDVVEADYSVSNFIANGYIDLAISDKIIPYVGAGAGFARINYHETRKLTCTPDAAATCSFPAGSTGESTTMELNRDEQYWAFAYQLSAGAAIKMTDRVSLDLGYTYLNVADGENFVYENGLAVNEDGFAIHQGSVGIRYDIN